MAEGDFTGLDAFAEGKKPKARLRRLKATDSMSALEQLRQILQVNFQTVLVLFRHWDEDGNGQISKVEFRRALPALGVAVARDDADNLFDEFDTDGSGEISYVELNRQLHAGAEVELDAALQDGAAGEIVVEAKNKVAIRSGLNTDVITMFGSSAALSAESETPIIEQLKRALSAPTVLARVIDIFRVWDEDRSGTVSKKEFARALPMLGLHVAREKSDELFEIIDEDGSGQIEYAEMHKKLRKTAGGASTLPAVRPTRRGSAYSATSGAGSSAKDAVKEAIAAERAAKHEMLQMLKKLRETDRREAAVAHRSRVAAVGAAVRAESDARIGRDVSAAISKVAVASADEVRHLAVQLYKQLGLVTPSGHEWIHLFRLMDEDKSGRISFAELHGAVRKLLHLDAAALPDQKLKALWRALDGDMSGFIDAGEFGRFIGKGKPPPEKTTSKMRVQNERTAVTRAMRAELQQAQGKAYTTRIAARGVEKASEDDVLQLSRIFNQELLHLPPGAREWYHLFKQIDDSGAGIISYPDLERALRMHLKVPRSTLPDERLCALWLTLDEDQNGSIDAGEFGRFMRRANMKQELMKNAGLSQASDVDLKGKNWVPASSHKYNDADGDHEMELAAKAEVKRAEAEAARLKEKADMLAAELRRRERKLQAAGAGEDRPKGEYKGTSGLKPSQSAPSGVVATALPAIGLQGSNSAAALPRARQRRKVAPAAVKPQVPMQTLAAYGAASGDAKARARGVGARVRTTTEPWTRQLREEAETMQLYEMMAGPL